MEQTDCSEMSAYKFQTPANYPEESIQHSEHGESLKSRIAKSNPPPVQNVCNFSLELLFATFVCPNKYLQTHARASLKPHKRTEASTADTKHKNTKQERQGQRCSCFRVDNSLAWEKGINCYYFIMLLANGRISLKFCYVFLQNTLHYGRIWQSTIGIF